MCVCVLKHKKKISELGRTVECTDIDHELIFWCNATQPAKHIREWICSFWTKYRRSGRRYRESSRSRRLLTMQKRKDNIPTQASNQCTECERSKMYKHSNFPCNSDHSYTVDDRNFLFLFSTLQYLLLSIYLSSIFWRLLTFTSRYQFFFVFQLL